MDGSDAVLGDTWNSIWPLIRSYLTPATLFLFVNLVIGTIALSSRSHRRHVDHPASAAGGDYYHPPPAPPPPPPPLARTSSSVLERLRSLSLYRFRSGDFPPEFANPNPDPIPDTVPEALPLEQRQPPPPHACTSSVLERLRSLSLYRFRSGDLPPELANPSPDVIPEAPPPQQPENHHQFDRSRSETAARPASAAKAKAKAKAKEKQMNKSSSETSRTAREAAMAAAEEEEVGVDAKADDFIKKFRQQLKLQRLNSLLNYDEMLNRGK